MPNVDRIFDITVDLSAKAPKENMAKQEYHSNFDDPHPNGNAATDMADVFKIV
ncbi:hypothetical protein [Clostridium sp.]|uniref:hypothetical protein n=1 Tax=Clostridium sp. TaxID=1506 RepID=UPI002636C3CC|nr:hypothetical protein [uncultured Clostridium sp.]